MVPTVEFPPVMLSTNQLTALLLSLVTTAANCSVPDGSTHGAEGVTATAAGGVPDIPVPCSGTTIGLPAAFSAIVRFVMRFPRAWGSNLDLYGAAGAGWQAFRRPGHFRSLL